MPKEIHLTPKDYQLALASQGACNVSGLVKTLASIIDDIWEEARELGQGTDWVNSHPIVVLYAQQIYHLSGELYISAVSECELRAKENQEVTHG